MSPDPHWNTNNFVFGDSPTLRNDRFVPSVHAILQSGNLFVYTMNNPVRWSDPTGLFAVDPSASWVCPWTLKYAGKYIWMYAKPYADQAWSGIKWVGIKCWDGLRWVGGEMRADAQAFGRWAQRKADQHYNWLGRQWNNITGIFSRGGQPDWGSLSRASEFGTRNYADMQRTLRGTGLHAHHIVDQRFGLNIDVTVAVTRAEHQVFTNAMRTQIPFGSIGVTKEQVWNASQNVYADFPAILEAIRQALGF